MIEICRMELADIGANPRRLAEEVLRQVGLVVPFPVEEVAKASGIKEIRALETQSFVGGLIQDNEKQSGSILVNQNSPATRKRFTIGHELGHFLNPSHVPPNGLQFLCAEEDIRMMDSSHQNRIQRMELEANTFAAEILMPRSSYSCRSILEPELSHARELAETHHVSLEASANRLFDLQTDPCALLFAKNSTIRYPRYFNEFPFLGLRKGSVLPECSEVVANPFPCLSNKQEVNWENWFENDPEGVLYEQALKLDYGYSITLLHFEPYDLDEPEMEELDGVISF